MEKIGNLHQRVGSLISQSINDQAFNNQIIVDDEDAENAPNNFSMAFSMADGFNGISNNQLTNGNTKCKFIIIILIFFLINFFFFVLISYTALDGTSNLSFTFNGDSMNNSISNSTDLDLTITTPLKTESRQEKIQQLVQVSTPKNFNNITSTISNGNNSFKFNSRNKSRNSYISDGDIKEENKQVKINLFFN